MCDSSKTFFVCLGFFIPLENFSFISQHDRLSAANLTYARQSWPLSSVGSLACHTYCDTGHPYKMVSSEDPWHSHLLPSFLQWSCQYLFLRHKSRFEHPAFCLRGERSNPLRHRCGSKTFKVYLEALLLLVKGCKWAMLGTHGHCGAIVLLRATPTVTRANLLMVISEDLWHSHLPSVWQWSCHYLF